MRRRAVEWLERDLRARFHLSSPLGQTEVRLAVHGVHQVPNALAAAAVALWCGVPVEPVGAALAVTLGSPLRMEVHHVTGGLMAELGDNSEAEHRRIALLAGELGIEVVGYETGLYGEMHVTGVDEAVALLRTMGPGDAALVKGSRVGRLEDVVRAYGEADGAPLLTPTAAAGRHEMPENKK
jgi:UDP-N-acetylmuramoyl-tripeptide--D-alanyl-D-alanine ligase